MNYRHSLRTSVMLGFVFAVAWATSGAAYGEVTGEVTFAEDVAPILLKNCVNCHRPGETAPMSLLTYDEARPWAKSIKKVVLSKEMPPWDADPAHGKFRNDISLTQIQIDAIAAWVDQGAPQGDADAMPPSPEFVEGWQLGAPDYVIELPEVEIAAQGPDIFPNLDATIAIPEERWIRAVEVRPSNRKATHHMVVFSSGFGAAGSDALIPDFLAVWAVGTPPQVYAEGMGRIVRPNARVRVNMHYHSYGEPAKDQTKIGLYFGEGEIEKEVSGQFAGTVNFAIPPGAKDHRLAAKYLVDDDMQIVSFFPHMHMRGRNMKYTATYPDGRNEVLLSVPNYDFNWQWFYYPEEPVLLPKGTRLDIEAHYDNSAENPNNPDPSIMLTFGEESTDEMMFGAFEFIPVEGRSPKPVNLSEKVDALLADYDPAHSYKVQVDFGMMKLTTAFVLPSEGEGIWYFPLGRQLLDIPLRNVRWDGTAFEAEVVFLGQSGAKVRGTVDANGSLTGEFDFTQLDESRSPQPQFDGRFKPKGFQGRRVGGGEKVAGL